MREQLRRNISIGFESGCTPAADRARVEPVIEGLTKLGYNAFRAVGDERVDIRVVSRLGSSRRSVAQQALVLNISDAILSPPNMGLLRNMYFAHMVRPRLARELATFDVIVAGSMLQAQSFETYCRAIVIPDAAIYLSEYEKASASRSDAGSGIVIVWEGQGHNFPYLEKMLKQQREIFAQKDVRIRVVTDEWDPIRKRRNRNALGALNINAEFVTWKPETFMSEVGKAHIGVAPLDMNCRFARAKPENKAVNYLSMGLPAICSSTPAYQALASRCPAAFVCDDALSWSRCLRNLIERARGLRQLGESGHEFVKSSYGQMTIANEWAALVNQLMGTQKFWAQRSTDLVRMVGGA
jgi:hypothetical protein